MQPALALPSPRGLLFPQHAGRGWRLRRVNRARGSQLPAGCHPAADAVTPVGLSCPASSEPSRLHSYATRSSLRWLLLPFRHLLGSPAALTRTCHWWVSRQQQFSPFTEIDIIRCSGLLPRSRVAHSAIAKELDLAALFLQQPRKSQQNPCVPFSQLFKGFYWEIWHEIHENVFYNGGWKLQGLK